MNMETHVGPLARRLMTPPGWGLFILVGVAVMLSIWAAATPMPSGHFVYIMESLLSGLQNSTSWYLVLTSLDDPAVRIFWAMVAWAAVFSIWLVRRLLRGAAVMRVSGKRAAPLAYWRRWLIPHLLLGATVIVCLTPAPVYLGFWLSKAALERIEQLQRQGAGRVAGTESIGVYPPPRRGRSYGPTRGVIYLSPWGGFVHAPGGPPDQDPSWDERFSRSGWWERNAHRYRYVGGGWYAFERRIP
jgi:hypothetical protein